MSKITTPAMEKIAKKQAKRKNKRNTPLTDVWRRLRRDRRAMIGLVIFVILVIVALFPMLFTKQSYSAQDYKAIHQLPSAAHLFGTDHLGRDIFTRVIHGTKVSLGIGIASVAIALLLGGILGAVSA